MNDNNHQRSALFKKKVLNMCERYFPPAKASYLQENVISWLLEHPNLYIEDRYEIKIYLRSADDENKNTPVVKLLEYLTYVVREDRSSIDLLLELVTTELEKFKLKKRHTDQRSTKTTTIENLSHQLKQCTV